MISTMARKHYTDDFRRQCQRRVNLDPVVLLGF